MAFSKITVNGTTNMDVTATTATADKILTGYGCVGADGEWVDGEYVQGGPDVPVFTAEVDQNTGGLTNISCDWTFAEVLDYADTNAMAVVEIDLGGATVTYGATVHTVSGSGIDFSLNAGIGGTPVGDITMASTGACTWSSPSAATTTLTATENRTYSDPSGRLYREVTVAVPSSTPTLQSKTATPTTSQQTVTADAGYDGLSSVQINAMPSGTAGTPSASKGTVSNHSVSVTPSVTNSTGWITGSTKTGTAVTVSASELVSGSETKTANGTYNVTNLASLVVAIPIVTYYTSSSNPTSSQGSNGDIWLVTS